VDKPLPGTVISTSAEPVANVRLPRCAGVGLKPQHYRDVLNAGDPGLWIEVHPENYMVAGGPRLAWLEALRCDRALSFHGVGASIGGLDPFDRDHLARLRDLIERFEPEQVSEHAVWSAHQGVYYADLLPLPRTHTALTHLVDRVDAFQTAIGRTVLLENPTNYLPFASEMDEPEFLVETARRSGCGLLVDINNIWISANNVGIDPHKYINSLPPALVGELHIAGYMEDPELGRSLLIDHHGAAVSEAVWSLLDFALGRLGPKPVLVERDTNIPDFSELDAERRRADAALARVGADQTARHKISTHANA